MLNTKTTNLSFLKKCLDKLSSLMFEYVYDLKNESIILHIGELEIILEEDGKWYISDSDGM